MIKTEMTTSAKQETSALLRVGIQGYAGAFHELAARQYFQDRELEVVPAHTFRDLVAAIEKGDAMDLGLMAIENTLAGSIIANEELLRRSELLITGEVFLPIQQNLLVNPGVRIEDLTEVHSHPVANVQCLEFFEKHPHIELIDKVDTALSARDVRDNGWKHVGAIASTAAAKLYGLEVLAAGIETNKQNYTRFLVLERAESQQTQSDATKVSVSFAVGHEVGSLYKILSVLTAYNVNMTKIKSMPIIGRPWEYRFFIDFIIQGTANWEQTIDAIRPITSELKVLGAYPKGKRSK